MKCEDTAQHHHLHCPAPQLKEPMARVPAAARGNARVAAAGCDPAPKWTNPHLLSLKTQFTSVDRVNTFKIT